MISCGPSDPVPSCCRPLLRARAAAAESPKLVAVFFPNGPSGNVDEVFYPGKSSAGWSWAGKFTEPLQEFSSRATVVRRLALNRGEHNFNQGYHGAGIVSWLTGTDEMNYANGTDHHSAQIPSLDQHIARQTSTKVFYTAVGRGKIRVASVSYAGNDLPATPEQDPEKAYAQVFGGGLSAGACDAQSLEASRRTARRDLLVLDRIHKDLASARRVYGLSADERAKLGAYEDLMASVEARLRKTESQTACEKREIPSFSFAGKHLVPQAIRLHCDVMALALALTDTRAGVLQLFHDSNDQDHSGWLPVPAKGHHKLQHEGPNAEQNCRLITRWFAEQLAYLLRKMDGLKVGQGTLLDQSIVLWGTDNPKGIGKTAAHAFTFDYGQLVFGGGAGRLRPGRDIDLGRRVNHVNVLGTIARAMGVDTSFYEKRKGWQGFVTDMLAG